MKTAFIIAASVLGGLAVLLFVLRTVFRALRKNLDEAITRRFAERSILRQSLSANFFGLTSLGHGQIRGNGGLVLSEDELFFVLGLPRREFIIPLERVTEVKEVSSHLGKSVFHPLLYVAFQGENGEDSIAWCVPDTDVWIRAIEGARELLR